MADMGRLLYDRPEHGECPLLVGGVDLVLLPQAHRFHPAVPAAAHHPPARISGSQWSMNHLY
jgi:hypothetical protein